MRGSYSFASGCMTGPHDFDRRHGSFDFDLPRWTPVGHCHTWPRDRHLGAWGWGFWIGGGNPINGPVRDWVAWEWWKFGLSLVLLYTEIGLEVEHVVELFDGFHKRFIVFVCRIYSGQKHVFGFCLLDFGAGAASIPLKLNTGAAGW